MFNFRGICHPLDLCLQRFNFCVVESKENYLLLSKSDAEMLESLQNYSWLGKLDFNFKLEEGDIDYLSGLSVVSCKATSVSSKRRPISEQSLTTQKYPLEEFCFSLYRS